MSKTLKLKKAISSSEKGTSGTSVETLKSPILKKNAAVFLCKRKMSFLPISARWKNNNHKRTT